MKNSLSSLYSRLGRPEKAAFISALAFGFITHLHIFSVNFISRDAVNIDNLGATFSSGRWTLGFMHAFASKLLGTWQLPFINGFISLLFIALSLVFLINALEVKKNLTAVFIGMAVVSFPSVASHFAFMFTAPAYFLALFLSTLSIYIFHKHSSIGTFFAGAFLLCLAIGIYQAYLCFAVSFALVIVLVHGLRHQISFSDLLKKGIYFVLIILVGLILYFIVNKAVLTLMDTELVEYQGLDKMGQIDSAIILQAISRAYSDQLQPSWPGIITSSFELNLIRLVNLLSIILILRLTWRCKGGAATKLLLLLAAALSPLAFNSIHIMVPEAVPGVHSLMRMSLIFTFVLPAICCEILSEQSQARQKLRFDALLLACSIFTLSLLPPTYCYRDNTAYLNAELVEEQAEAYFSSMINRIRSTSGYRDELPVAYLGSYIGDSTLTKLPMNGKVYTFVLGFSLEEVLNENNWREFCALHLGWSPTELDDVSYFEQHEHVQQMPCYPDDGSIEIIENTIVVKLSEIK